MFCSPNMERAALTALTSLKSHSIAPHINMLSFVMFYLVIQEMAQFGIVYGNEASQDSTRLQSSSSEPCLTVNSSDDIVKKLTPHKRVSVFCLAGPPGRCKSTYDVLWNCPLTVRLLLCMLSVILPRKLRSSVEHTSSVNRPVHDRLMIVAAATVLAVRESSMSPKLSNSKH
jgi:hypothetical protein